MSILDNIKYYANKSWLLTLDFIDWHKDFTNDIAHKYNLCPWAMGLIGFAKGVLVVLSLQWLF